MTKISTTLALAFLVVSCTKPTTNGTAEHLADSVSISTTIAPNPAQPTVDIDTLNEIEFKDLFQVTEARYYNLHKDSESMKLLSDSREFWKKKVAVNNEVKTLEIWGHPLSYRVLNKNIIRATTITEGEAENKIIAFTFNRNYERIDTETLASYGGDQGEVWRTYGEFTSDTTFIKTVVSYSSEDSLSTRRAYNLCIRFKRNGQIEEKENCR